MPAEPFVGQIMPAAFGFVPKGWHACDGALLPVAQYQALFALLSTTYGGNGITTFGLPDLRGRAVLGSDLGTVPWGQVAGTETVPLQTSQLPNHRHDIQASTTAGAGRPTPPAGKLFGQNTSGALVFAMAGSAELDLSSDTNITKTGGSQAHNNMQPSQVVNFVIAMVGVFPSRP